MRPLELLHDLHHVQSYSNSGEAEASQWRCNSSKPDYPHVTHAVSIYQSDRCRSRGCWIREDNSQGIHALIQTASGKWPPIYNRSITNNLYLYLTNRHNDAKRPVRCEHIMVHIVKQNVSVPLRSLGGKSQARPQVGMKAASVNQSNKSEPQHLWTDDFMPGVVNSSKMWILSEIIKNRPIIRTQRKNCQHSHTDQPPCHAFPKWRAECLRASPFHTSPWLELRPIHQPSYSYRISVKN